MSTAEKPGKHVIFLGAGASYSAGYPLADGLRKQLSSSEQIKIKVLQKAPVLSSLLDSVLKEVQTSMDRFRKGAFSTVDQFCKLHHGHPEDAHFVDQMRQLTAFVLALHNPEELQNEADYYSFVNQLFDDSICGLRDDITVLSFNYDCYLDFLLYQAVRERILSRNEFTAELKSRLTSGYTQPQAWAAGPISTVPKFSLLKLHGVTSWVNNADHVGHKVLFAKEDPGTRIAKALHHFHTTPHIAFPWELFGNQSSFLDSEHDDVERRLRARVLERSWKEAQLACSIAEKVSFVGLSMHEYLQPGFKFLFSKRTKPLNTVAIANHDTDEHSPTGVIQKTKTMLGRMGLFKHGPPFKNVSAASGLRDLESYGSFQDFIGKGMFPHTNPA